MSLFKPKALPVVLDDIATSIHRASYNSTTALGILHESVRVDPPSFNLDALVSVLSQNVFRLRKECFPSKEVARLLDESGIVATEQQSSTYWAVFSHLYALLPALVEMPRVGGLCLGPQVAVNQLKTTVT